MMHTKEPKSRCIEWRWEVEVADESCSGDR